jgi:hypothetical protein
MGRAQRQITPGDICGSARDRARPDCCQEGRAGCRSVSTDAATATIGAGDLTRLIEACGDRPRMVDLAATKVAIGSTTRCRRLGTTLLFGLRFAVKPHQQT